MERIARITRKIRIRAILLLRFERLEPSRDLNLNSAVFIAGLSDFLLPGLYHFGSHAGVTFVSDVYLLKGGLSMSELSSSRNRSGKGSNRAMAGKRS